MSNQQNRRHEQTEADYVRRSSFVVRLTDAGTETIAMYKNGRLTPDYIHDVVLNYMKWDPGDGTISFHQQSTTLTMLEPLAVFAVQNRLFDRAFIIHGDAGLLPDVPGCVH